jgi:cytochrome P450
MGAHLARLEVRTVSRHLLHRVDSFDVCGPVKRLPLRCRIV